MPYQGTLVSVDQMFDQLVKAGQDRRDAAIALQRALEDNAIVLIFNGAPLSPSQRSGLGDCLRAFAFDPRDAKLHFGWAIDIMQHARASRVQFETVCSVVNENISATTRETAQQACESLILSLKKGPRLTKAQVHAQARAKIPDLQDKEFDLAWRAVAGEWATGGRPKKTLN
jgi:hypothetical protein